VLKGQLLEQARPNEVVAEAVEAYRTALRLEPDNADALYLAGRAYSRQGLVKEALAALEKAARIKARFADAASYLIVGERSGYDPLTAEYIYSSATLPDEQRVALELGCALAKDGHFVQALDTLAAVAKATHNAPEVLYDQALAHMALGQHDKATSLFGEALKQKPDLVQARINLAAIALRENRTGEAAGSLDEVLKTTPMMVAKADRVIANAKRDLAAARQGLQALANQYANHARLAYNLGFAAQSQRDTATAKAAYQRALDALPQYPQALYNLAVIALQEARLTEAETHLKAAIALVPEYADAHNLLGTLYQRQQKPVQLAQREFEKAVALDPGFAAAHANLGTAYGAQGLGEKEMTAYQTAAELRAKQVKVDTVVPDKLPTTGILPFRQLGTVPDFEGKQSAIDAIVSQQLSMYAQGKLTLVNRTAMDAAMDERGLAYSDVGDPANASKLKGIKIAERLVAGALGSSGDALTARASLVDVTQGTMSGGAVAKGNGETGLEAIAEELAERLAEQLGIKVNERLQAPDAGAAATGARAQRAFASGDFETAQRLARQALLQDPAMINYLGGDLLNGLRARATNASADTRFLQVKPFTVGGGADKATGEVVSELVKFQLAQFPFLRVVGTEAVATYSASRTDIGESAVASERRGADFVLSGTCNGDGRTLTAIGQLVDPQSNTVLLSETVTGAADDAEGVAARLAERILAAVKGSVSDDDRRRLATRNIKTRVVSRPASGGSGSRTITPADRWIGATLSALFPGLGQFYQGKGGRGLGYGTLAAVSMWGIPRLYAPRQDMVTFVWGIGSLALSLDSIYDCFTDKSLLLLNN
jgi:tetratricopeptide (TPR) repeat protein/TolB-like protein/TM2 domain-containing membrane protein YozV